jgi:peptide/nickel transport system ATP-binding protein
VSDNTIRSGPLLRVTDLRTTFQTSRGPLRAVDGVSFDLEQGATIGIVGESGSGKSVLVRTIMNLLPPNGEMSDDTVVLFAGRDVRDLQPSEAKHFWGTEMAMIFQDPMTSLNPVKKIGAQLTESMRFHLGYTKAAAVDRALDLLDQVGIPEPRRRLGQYPHELSGGMRQRITIAIALACEPRLLIADEPTTALDVTVQKQILDLLSRIQRERRMAMILITHDLGVVAGHADHVAVMYAGQIVESAPTDRLFRNVEHPYTEALHASIPRIEYKSHTRLDAISGRPPDMTNPPQGCRFAPRCKYAAEACLARLPELMSTEATAAQEPTGLTVHRYRCYFPVGRSGHSTAGAGATTSAPAPGAP